MEYPPFKVSVRCFTYNQAKYIINALDSFCMQQTNFPFICCVVDDASTDEEPQIIHNYFKKNFDLTKESGYYERTTETALISYARHRTNKNCYFAILHLKVNHHSIKKYKSIYLTEWEKGCSYTALCEGDDYWTDPFKLQKQVDYMETHPECTLCIHAYTKLFSDGTSQAITPKERHSISRKKNGSIQETYTLEDILPFGAFMATNTYLYPSKYNHNRPSWFYSITGVGDIPLITYLASQGTVKYFPDNMSVYRAFAEGSWTLQTTSDINRAIFNQKERLRFYHMVDLWYEKKYHKQISNIQYCITKFLFKLYICKYLNINLIKDKSFNFSKK